MNTSSSPTQPSATTTKTPSAPAATAHDPQATLLDTLRALGIAPPTTPPPADAVMLTGDDGEIASAAEAIFTKAREQALLYRLGDTVVRPDQKLMKLVPETAHSFRSTIERLGPVYQPKRKADGTRSLKRRQCSLDSAQALLACGEGRGKLTTITHASTTRLLVQPADIPDGFRLLAPGFHAHGGGTLIWEAAPEIPEVPLDEATAFIIGSLSYYKFATPADRSRAIAAILTPALKRGGFISGHVPMVFVQADRPGAGKTQKTLIISAYYGIKPLCIAPAARGVGSMSEAISTAIIDGQTDILIDNVRQLPDAEFIEALITGNGVSGRAAFERCRSMETSGLNLMMTTNGISLTEDLASRSNMIEIHRHGGYCDETPDALATIRGKQPYALGCIYAVLKAWCSEGRPKVKVSSCRFPDWAATVNGIVTRIFGLPDIGAGAEQSRNKASSPQLRFLMEVGDWLFSEEAGYTGGSSRKLTTKQLLAAAQCSEVDLGTLVKEPDAEPVKVAKSLGMALARDSRLKSGESIDCGAFIVRRVKDSTNKDGPVYEFDLKPQHPAPPSGDSGN